MSRQHSLTLDEIAETLFVSRTFGRKVIQLYENTGAVDDPPSRKSKKRLSGKSKCGM